VKNPLAKPSSVELYLNGSHATAPPAEEEVSLAKEIENGRILLELSDAWMLEHGAPPTDEQLAVRFIEELLDGLAVVRRSKVFKGLPKPYVEQLNFDLLTDAIQDRLDEQVEADIAAATKRNVAELRPKLITLAVAQRIFPAEVHRTLNDALQGIHDGALQPLKAKPPQPVRGRVSKRAMAEYKAAESAHRKAKRDTDASAPALPYIRTAVTSRSAEKHMVNANLRLVVSVAKSTPAAACRSWTSSRRATAD
jgi:hypothetical protein